MISYLESMLHSFLVKSYPEAVKEVRRLLSEHPEYKENWPIIIRSVLNKELEVGKPLDLIHDTANLPLYENSDEEAYKWLNLLIINAAGGKNDPILDYEELFNPDHGFGKTTFPKKDCF